MSAPNTRTTIGHVYVGGGSKGKKITEASQLLRQILGNAHTYDSADRLFVELRTMGFSPVGVNVSEDSKSASAFIEDPNIGRLWICCQEITASVH